MKMAFLNRFRQVYILYDWIVCDARNSAVYLVSMVNLNLTLNNTECYDKST